MAFKVYISPSCQEGNVGAGKYGTEEAQMQSIGALVIDYLKKHGDIFEVYHNDPSWTLSQVVRDSIAKDPHLHVAIHSDAYSATSQGTSVYYNAKFVKSKAIADYLYSEIAPLSPGKDKGVMVDTVLYKGGLGELKDLRCASALIEVAFHSNPEEAQWIMDHHQLIAYGIYRAICTYFRVKPGPINTPQPQGPFKDILGHLAEADILKAYQLGIIKGNGSGNFNPDAPITRAQVVIIINRLYDILRKGV